MSPKSSRLLIVVLLLLGLAGAVTYARLRHEVFRWASLDLKMTRAEAFLKGEAFLLDKGYSIEGYKSSAKFWSYETPAIYFEKQMGTDAANRLMAEEHLPLSGWEVRFFRPLQKEEYRVWWSPAGELIGFSRDLLREKKLPSLSMKQARGAAESFLLRNFALAFPRYKLSASSTEQRPRRTDHSFRWLSAESPLKSRIYLSVTVSGNEITSARHEVEVPESFVLAEESVQERRNLLSGTVQRIDLGLMLALALFLLTFWKRRWLRWRGAVLLASVVLLFSLLGEVNDLPLKLHDYVTTKTLAAFWSTEIGYSVIIALVGAAWLALQLASADTMGRTLPKTEYSLGEVATLRFFRSRAFLTATLAGFGVAGIQLGFVVLYYIAGNRLFHFYAPLEAHYDDLLTTSVPWVSPLLTGLEPALTEEAIYRLFAIPLLFKLTKRKWIAVLLPALLWGFMHTGYYVEPIYARGLELTLVGILLGVIYLRYGIWATIVGHYVYNTTLSSSLLLSSSSPYLQVSSALVIGAMAIPLAITAARWLLGSAPLEFPFASIEWPARAHKVISLIDRRRRTEPTSLGLRWPAAALVFCLAIVLPCSGTLSPASLKLDRAGAIESARKQLDRLGYSSDGYFVSSSLSSADQQASPVKYARENLSTSQAGSWLDRYQPVDPRWNVRFISPSSPRRCEIQLTGAGTVSDLDCRLPEEEPAKSLGADESKKLAEGYLTSWAGDPSKFRYVGATEQERRNRIDRSLQWTDPAAEVAQMKRYVSVDLAGNQISGYTTYLKTPESFLREQNLETFWSVLRGFGFALIGVILTYTLLRSFFDRIVISSFRSRIALGISCVSVGLAAADFWNHLPTFWGGYDASMSVPVFLGHQALALLGKMAAWGLGTYILSILFLRLPPQLFPDAPSTYDLSVILKRPPWRWRQAPSMFLWALALALVQLALYTLLLKAGPSMPRTLLENAYASFSTQVPLLHTVVSAWNSLLYWIAIASGFAACKKYLSAWLTYFALGLFIFVFASAQHTSALEVLQGVAALLLTAWVVLARVRFRLPFYLWYVMLQSAIPFVPWLFSDNPTFRSQAFWVVLSAGLVAAALALRAGGRALMTEQS